MSPESALAGRARADGSSRRRPYLRNHDDPTRQRERHLPQRTVREVAHDPLVYRRAPELIELSIRFQVHFPLPEWLRSWGRRWCVSPTPARRDPANLARLKLTCFSFHSSGTECVQGSTSCGPNACNAPTNGYATCAGETCVYGCNAGLTLGTNGGAPVCLNLLGDPANCGTEGAVCPGSCESNSRSDVSPARKYRRVLRRVRSIRMLTNDSLPSRQRRRHRRMLVRHLRTEMPPGFVPAPDSGWLGELLLRSLKKRRQHSSYGGAPFRPDLSSFIRHPCIVLLSSFRTYARSFPYDRRAPRLSNPTTLYVVRPVGTMVRWNVESV